MKKLHVPYIGQIQSSDLKVVDHYFDHNLNFEYIDMLNWPQLFPYKPDVKFKVLRTETSIFIKYYVREKSLRAMYADDQEPVWEDSCVEFFFRNVEDDFYYNFEFNCIGTCVATKRKGRNEDVSPLNKEQLQQIKRLPSLGKVPFGRQEGVFEWTLMVEIPLIILNLGEENMLASELYANFYKCGDETQFPHYLSWNYILSEQPDFHLPEYFGELILQ